MKKIEIIGKRKPREKHFLQDDGTFVAEMYDENIHVYKNGHYEEIDNRLEIKKDLFINDKNDYKMQFSTNIKNDYILELEKYNKYIKMSLENINNITVVKNESKNKFYETLVYENILNNIDLKYEIKFSKIKENIIINSKESDIDKLNFIIDTNAIIRENNNGTISILNDLDEILFEFEAPYFIDSQNSKDYNVKYTIEKINNYYRLSLSYDHDWLYKEAKFPVILDPTIIDYSTENNIIDTYIYPGDSNTPRGELGSLKVGVENNNGTDIVNRTLIKFNLPTLGTGSQVIKAQLNLTDLPDATHSYYANKVDVHRVTQDWQENTANWDTMNDKYDNRIDGAFECYRFYDYHDGHYTYLSVSQVDITPIVQKWYTGVENYGLMLKASNEVFHNKPIAIFFSKNNILVDLPIKPSVVIMYRNQSGLEEYMNYENQTFQKGNSYHNTYNGNLTHILDLTKTKNCSLPVELKLIYNTNDVVLNKNIGFGLGFRLNVCQTIQPQVIGEKTYLEYVDEDGTLHYFINERRELVNGAMQTITYENKYFDEDDPQLVIDVFDTYYMMTNKNNFQKKFIKNSGIGFLSKIIDSNSEINITYDNENRVTNISDSDNQSISISYNQNSNQDIVITNTNGSYTEMHYSSNKLVSVNYIYPQNTEVISYTYNNHNLIENITDVTGKTISYEYYEKTPYRIKKVIEYGLNQTIGNYYEVDYGFNVTTITDQDDKIRRIIFSSNGSPSSIVRLTDENSISNAYGAKLKFGDEFSGGLAQKNKILREDIPIKSVKNLLRNSSFEEDTLYFRPGQDTVIYISDEFSNTGFKSLRYKSNSGAYESEIRQTLEVDGGKYYTFSAYVKRSIWYAPVKLFIKYEDNQGIHKVESDSISVDDFTRLDVTTFVPENIYDHEIIIGFILEGTGLCFIDDVQLEESRVVNNYNLIENSDFSNGIIDWNFESEDPTNFPVSNIFSVERIYQQSMLKVKMCTYNSSGFNKVFNISGRQSEKHNLSFWFKNEGISGGFDEMGSPINNSVTVIFFPSDPDTPGGDKSETFQLNPCEGEWQFFNYNFTAPFDFNKVKIIFNQSLNGNNFYITNLNFFKDLPSIEYQYDSNGNIKRIKNKNNSKQDYKYDFNNELSGIFNSKGKNFYYEYDNNDTGKVIRGISNMGISAEILYDSKNHPIITRLINRGYSDLISNGKYKIRIKGTNQFLSVKDRNLIINNNSNGILEWNLEKVTIDDEDYFKISHAIINSSYITVSENNIILSAFNENSLFELLLQDNGSYLLKNKITGKYLKIDNNTIVNVDLEENKTPYEFYFEKIGMDKFSETNIYYDSNLKNISKTVDTSLLSKEYIFDSNTGFIDVFKNPKNISINYVYDSKGRLQQIIKKDRILEYEYYSNNKIKKIIQGNRIINYEYDDFLNISSININNVQPLNIKTFYLNNGPLSTIQFGNNQSVNYIYDDFKRVKNINRSDEQFEYVYDNNSNLSKIISTDNVIKFSYDLNKNLYNYNNGDFNIEYNYDVNNNITKHKYRYKNIDFSINKVFNDDDSIVSVNFGNATMNYSYDSYGRLISNSLGSNYIISYDYYDNGYRITSNVKSKNNNGDIYKYVYNKHNEIEKIYHNDVLENRYYYNDFNELIREDNFITQQTIRYKYDSNGNILLVNAYELNSYNLVLSEKYEYNSSWKDQLIKFNNNIITYDGAGNILSIGNDISFGWINGKMLSEYSDLNQIISYKYNDSKYRISKTINGTETKYYLEGSKIIVEETLNSVIYYLWIDNNIIGFNYNNVQYLYEKNNLGDIIGILDTNYNVVAKYKYDSWGNILSITDGYDNDVSSNSNHIANINPFRYRGYYYDKETNLYYLKTRYYSPMLRRFISLDDKFTINEVSEGNLYSYCCNDPINNIDPSGQGKIMNFFKNLLTSAATKISTTLSKIAPSIFKSKVTTEKVKYDTDINYGAVRYATGEKKIATITKAGNDKAMVDISFNIPDKMFDIDTMSMVNYPSYSHSTNNDNFNVGLTMSNTTSVDLISNIGKGTQQISFGANMLGFYHFEYDFCTDGDYDYQVCNFIELDANVYILALATIGVTVAVPVAIPYLAGLSAGIGEVFKNVLSNRGFVN